MNITTHCLLMKGHLIVFHNKKNLQVQLSQKFATYIGRASSGERSGFKYLIGAEIINKYRFYSIIVCI